jgi:competence protein ComEC
MMAACFAAGLALMAAHPRRPAPSLSTADNTQAIFSGCVADPGLTGEDREHFTLELAHHARAQVSLFARPGEVFPSLPYGIEVEVEGKARRPRNFRNPGAFDNEHYLARRAIYWTISASTSAVHATGKRCGNPFARALFAIRGAALDRLDGLYRDDIWTDGMMQAVLIGVTARLDRLWTEDYRRTGTYHALVISGSHIAVIASVLLFFLRILGTPRGIALAAGIAVAWIYAGIAGFDPPVLRSAAGMSMFGAASVFYRRARLLNLVAAVALFFVIADPEIIFDASFQLSFLAVALIGAFAVPAIEATSGPLAEGLTDLANRRRDLHFPPRVAQFRVELRLLAQTAELWLGAPPRLARVLVTLVPRLTFYIWEIFLTSAFIQIGLALPMIYFFHRLPASGLTANILVVPALSAVVPLGFAAIVLNSHWLAAAAKWFLVISQWAASLHARWEPDWRIPQPPLWLAAVFTIALILAGVRFRKRWPRLLAAAVTTISLAALIAFPFTPDVRPRQLELTAIDVGQGDSLLTVFPKGQLMLIDAGGIPTFGRAHRSQIDIGEDVVSPYLWTRSVRRLDVAVMTHAHADHIGGLPAILKNFHPRELWIGAVPDNPAWTEITSIARQLGIIIRPLRRGAQFDYGGANIQVLAPLADYQPKVQPGNNDSLVLRLVYGSTSFLLTGDMEKDIERQVVSDLPQTDVLKVGHHGSRTSSTPAFLDAVSPSIGIVSVGYENSYGHPHPQIIRALSERNITIYRTDEFGLVQIFSNGHTASAAVSPAVHPTVSSGQ